MNTFALGMIVACASPASELQAARADLATLPVEVRPYTRYFTVYDATPDQLESVGKILAWTCNHLSKEKVIRRPYQVSQTLWRVDLRWYAWDWKAFAKLTQEDYHYGKQYNYLIASAKFFIVQSTDLNRSDLYHDFLYGKRLRQLSEFQAAWPVDRKTVDKYRIQVGANIHHGDSGVTINNRVLAWSPTTYGGDYFESFDFLNSAGQRNVINKLRIGEFKHDAQELIVSLPNGLMAGELTNNAGKILERADVAIAKDSTAHKEPDVRSPVSCFRCHGLANGYHTAKADLPERLSKGLSLKTYDEETKLQLEAFYLTEDWRDIANGSLIHAARNRYEKAVVKCNGWTPGQSSIAYGDIIRQWDANLTLIDACQELGVSEEAFKAKVADTADGELGGLLVGGTISRDEWAESGYEQATLLIGRSAK